MKPTHKECRWCHEWFELPRDARPRRRFCSVSCWAKYRSSQPKWRKEQSARARAHADPEVMAERSREMWRNPETRAHLSEKVRERTNSKEHLAHMAEHNERLWSDEEFRRRHSKRMSERASKQWQDPTFREKKSAQVREQSKQRWTDPEYKERVSRAIRIAKAGTLSKRRQKEIARERMSTPQAQARSREIMKNQWADPEFRARRSKLSSELARRRWQEDPEYRKRQIATLRKNARANSMRMRQLNKQRWADPEYRAKMKAASNSPERKAAAAAENKRRWADPKYKARVAKRISMARKRRHDQHQSR